MREDGRPNPEDLLAQLHAQEEIEHKKSKGKLKIFLGFAAGTGKTYAMLEAAQDLKKHNVDVVVGYVEPHARPETTAMLKGLETIPFLMVDYKGIKVREFDLDAALRRHPKVLLVDELAHSNVPGCRHQKRYQDIEELLEHGINVYTTVNIQHLESLNDIVGTITGIEVKERIPDTVFDEADQVKLVDIETDELLDRMREGKIYQKRQAQLALQNFFTKDKLVALREIALRRMADRVNHLAEIERKVMGTGEFSAGEHVLTCISASPTNAKVIRAAARLAYAFHAEFTALYVETHSLQNMDEKAKKRRDENIALARALGAKVATVYGENVPKQIAEYAKVSNATKLVLGKTNHKMTIGRTRSALVDSINLSAPHLDVYIIPDLDHEPKKNQKYTSVTGVTRKIGKLTGMDVVKTVSIMLLCTILGIVLRELGMTEANVVMVYLLGVMVTATMTKGYLGSLLASVLGVILFNYFFTAPTGSLAVYDTSYPVTFVMMLFVSLFSSYMMNKIQGNSELNAKRYYRTEILLSNSQKLRRCFTREEVSNELASQIQKLMNFTVITYLQEDGKIGEPSVYLRKGIDENMQDQLRLNYTARTEKGVVNWVFNNGHRAGCTTHTLPDANGIYLPVMDGENVLAVVGMILEERREIGSFEYDVISAMLTEAALVLERIAKIEELERQSWNDESM